MTNTIHTVLTRACTIRFETQETSSDEMTVRVTFEFPTVGACDIDIDEVLQSVVDEIAELGPVSTPTHRHATSKATT